MFPNKTYINQQINALLLEMVSHYHRKVFAVIHVTGFIIEEKHECIKIVHTCVSIKSKWSDDIIQRVLSSLILTDTSESFEVKSREDNLFVVNNLNNWIRNNSYAYIKINVLKH